MNLIELKTAVDNAVEHAKEYGDESPSEIVVSLQIDGPKIDDCVFANIDVSLHYDNNLNASGCVLVGVIPDGQPSNQVDAVGADCKEHPDKGYVYKCKKCGGFFGGLRH